MLSPSLIHELQTELQGVTVLTPGADGYEASLKRWSETAEKRAVSPSIYQSIQSHIPIPTSCSPTLRKS